MHPLGLLIIVALLLVLAIAGLLARKVEVYRR